MMEIFIGVSMIVKQSICYGGEADYWKEVDLLELRRGLDRYIKDHERSYYL